MKCTKKLISVLLIFTLAFTSVLLSSCKKEDDKVYTFSLSGASAPFSSQKSDGGEGIDLDLLPAICGEAGIKYTVNYDGKDGDSDFYMVESEKGENKSYSYTSSYFDEGVICAVKDTSGVTSFEELLYFKIGVLADNDSISFANEISPQLCLELSEYEDFESLESALDSGKIDGVICPYSSGAENIKNGKLHAKIIGNVETTKSYGIYTKSSRYGDIIKKLNEAIKTIKENGKYQQIIENHLGKIPDSQDISG